jgi:hypothetical protein
MPNKEFLESYPLYRRYQPASIPAEMNRISEARINLACPVCNSLQTFTLRNRITELVDYSNKNPKSEIFRLVYCCTHCEKHLQHFYVRVDDKKESYMKVGQYPAWQTAADPEIERLLGSHSSLYRKGLICESQGYGIGAFGYYRRIVEEVIDQLLDEISDLIPDDEAATYQAAIEKSRQTCITQEKIDLVKDLLPPILRPQGMNPLSQLHSALSEGLHAGSDEECLEFAEAIRGIMVFLVNQIMVSRASGQQFTESMRKLLDKRNGQTS